MLILICVRICILLILITVRIYILLILISIRIHILLNRCFVVYRSIHRYGLAKRNIRYSGCLRNYFIIYGSLRTCLLYCSCNSYPTIRTNCCSIRYHFSTICTKHTLLLSAKRLFDYKPSIDYNSFHTIKSTIIYQSRRSPELHFHLNLYVLRSKVNRQK